MTTTSEHPSVIDTLNAARLLGELAAEARGNDQPLPVIDHKAVAVLVDAGWAVQIASGTADTPPTYKATTAGLIVAG